jgi:Protein of unknown function (DUF3096)
VRADSNRLANRLKPHGLQVSGSETPRRLWNNLSVSNVVACRIVTNEAPAVNLSIGPLVSLVAGVLILIVPRLLNYIVAIYLIIMGLLGLFGPFRV